MAGFGRGTVLEDSNDFSVLQPRRHQVNRLAAGIDAEEHAHIPRADADRVSGLVELDVIREQRAQAFPVAKIEQFHVVQDRVRWWAQGRLRRWLGIDLFQPGATAREMALYGIDSNVQKFGDVFKRMAEDVFQNNDAPLHDRKL